MPSQIIVVQELGQHVIADHQIGSLCPEAFHGRFAAKDLTRVGTPFSSATLAT